MVKHRLRKRAGISYSRTFRLDKLTRTQKEAFARDFYKVHRRIFNGLFEFEFQKYVFFAKAKYNKIHLYYNIEREIIGYCAIHLHKFDVKERSRYVLRAEAGLIPDYRGRHSNYTFGIIEAFKVKILRCPFSEFYYLGTLVHPSSYALFGYFFSDMTPHPNRERCLTNTVATRNPMNRDNFSTDGEYQLHVYSNGNNKT